jgi:hypothetical protein
MAIIPFTKVAFNGEGDVYSATVSTGDETGVLKFVYGEENVNVLVTGTVSGSTVTVQQTLDGINYGTAESVGGTTLALTVIGVVKRLWSCGIGLKVAVTAGTAAGLVVNVYVPRKVR